MSKARPRLSAKATLIGAFAVFIALLLAGIATAEKPVKVRAGNLELTFNGGFTLKEFNVETDKNGAINVKGLPVCTASKLQSQDTKHAEAICRPAIIGSGTATAEIAFPEQAPIPATSKIIAFNGGFKGGVTTLYIHAYLTVPTPAAIVTTVKIKKIHNGRYGLEAVSSIPKIAGGSGSVKSFSLTINKKGVLSAKCPDGKLQAHGTAVFVDGTRVSGEIVRTCTPKG